MAKGVKAKTYKPLKNPKKTPKTPRVGETKPKREVAYSKMETKNVEPAIKVKNPLLLDLKPPSDFLNEHRRKKRGTTLHLGDVAHPLA